MNSVTVSIICACIALLGVLLNLFMPRIWSKRDKSAGKLDTITMEIGNVKQEVGNVKQTLAEHIEEDERRDILQARRRVIDFADECRRGVRHSEEHFNNVLEDITVYDRYCASHPAFPNRQAESSIRLIMDVYDVCKRENDFI